MDLKIINHKTYKKAYFNFFTICVLVVSGSFILYKARINVFPVFISALSFQNILLYSLIGAALIFAFFVLNNRSRLRKMQTFDEKMEHYEKFFTRRLWWHVISCLTSAIFLLLTWHILFFYFGLFDILSMLSAYPSKEILKRELDEDDILFN